jgi:hypothetical protein
MGHYPVRFTEECDVLVATADVRERLRALVEAVIERLDGCAAQDARELREAWSAIQSLGGPDRILSIRAAALGLDGTDPEQVNDEMATALVDRLSSLPDPVVGDLLELPIQTSDSLIQHMAWVERARKRATAPGFSKPVDVERARVAVQSIRATASDVPAYQTGWDLAERARDQLFLLDSKAYGSEVTAKLEAWIPTVEEERSVEALRGWVGINGSVVAAVQAPDAQTRRWLAARAFCMTLLGGRERLVTDAQSWSQSVARAFATELLAPCALLRERVQSSVISEAELHALSDELGTPRRAVEHQLENHSIAVVET